MLSQQERDTIIKIVGELAEMRHRHRQRAEYLTKELGDLEVEVVRMREQHERLMSLLRRPEVEISSP